jgi:tellurite resistance protein TerC
MFLFASFLERKSKISDKRGMWEEIFRWGIFHVIIAVLLLLDLGVLQKKHYEISVKKALLWSLFWIVISLLFNLYIYLHLGSTKALEYFTGYIVEKSLSIDNLFIFVVIFSYFKVPAQYHHSVLFYGIIGALVLRLSLILGGIALIERFSFMIYLFALLIGYTGIRMVLQKKDEVKPEKNMLVRGVKKWLPVTDDYHGAKFFVRKRGRLWITPLLLVLLVIETTDVLFALDSIPAIFAITVDPYIVYTSNVFAVLGLRAMHFVLVGFYHKFQYLKVGLGAILIFVALKMMVSSFIEFPLGLSLLVIIAILAVSGSVSLVKGRK